MNKEAINEFTKASKMIKFKEMETSHHPSATFLEIMFEMMDNSKNQQYDKSIDELLDEGKSLREISKIYKEKTLSK